MAFTNKGEVPVNAFKLLGASNKREDQSKIGFFGTGLKYAIAVLLREDVEFKVFSGLQEVKIGVRSTSFLDQKVQVITVNNEKTSITIEAGIDWEGWFAIREIYSNALDEGGSIEIEEIKPEAGSTKIYVEMDSTKLGDVFQNWQKYFANKRPALYKNEYGRILAKLPGNQNYNVYRKGILSYKRQAVSLFDYDLNSLDINESRVAKYSWQALEKSSDLLAKSDSSQINEFINLSKDPKRSDYVEWQNEFWDYTGSFSPIWLEIINDRELIPNDYAGSYPKSTNGLVLPDKLIKKLREYFGKQVKVFGEDKAYIPLEDQSGLDVIKKSLSRLKELGFTYTGPVTIVNFKDKLCLGQYENKEILISESALHLTDSDLDLVMLEEILHAQSGFGDYTREFQTYIINTILSISKSYKP